MRFIFFTAKKEINGVRRQPTEWKKKSVISSSDKGLIFRILKNSKTEQQKSNMMF
jgi:hypothetical protein